MQLSMGMATLYSWGFVILIRSSTVPSATSSGCVLKNVLLLRLHCLFPTTSAALSTLV